MNIANLGNYLKFTFNLQKHWETEEFFKNYILGENPTLSLKNGFSNFVDGHDASMNGDDIVDEDRSSSYILSDCLHVLHMHYSILLNTQALAPLLPWVSTEKDTEVQRY